MGKERELNANHTQIDAISNALEVAKDAKLNITGQINDLEQQLVDAVGTAGEEGTETGNGEMFQVKIVTGYNYKVNEEAATKLADEMTPTTYQALFGSKVVLKLPFFRQLKAANPEAFDQACDAITATPKKISVKIERIKVEAAE